MIISFFSDTHGKHGLRPIGDYSAFKNCDAVVFCGDMSSRGHKHEVQDFLFWYSKMPVKYKLFVPGNHDFYFERSSEEDIKEILLNTNLIYLNDSGFEIDGIKFWGSPITPWFYNWAFNRTAGEIEKHWELIPNGTDVLITHGPPRGMCDLVNNSYSYNNREHVGCPLLKKHIARIKPQVHAFGHIHEGYGMSVEDDTTFINASIMNADYQAVNDPMFFDVNPRTDV